MIFKKKTEQRQNHIMTTLDGNQCMNSQNLYTLYIPSLRTAGILHIDGKTDEGVQ